MKFLNKHPGSLFCNIRYVLFVKLNWKWFIGPFSMWNVWCILVPVDDNIYAHGALAPRESPFAYSPKVDLLKIYITYSEWQNKILSFLRMFDNPV